MNEIMSTVFGNVASEPRHLVTPQGAPLTSFRLASTPTRFDQGVQGYVEGSTTWLTVTCWRGLAFNAARSLRKGQPVIVHGALHVREWKDGDRSGREVELDAVSVGHDLRRGRADFAKVLRPAGDRALLGGTPTPGPDDAAGSGAAANVAGAGDDGVAERGMGTSDADAPDGTGGDAPEREGGAAA